MPSIRGLLGVLGGGNARVGVGIESGGGGFGSPLGLDLDGLYISWVNIYRGKADAAADEIEQAARQIIESVLDNSSPAPAGSPPGVVSGGLRDGWVFDRSGGGFGLNFTFEVKARPTVPEAAYQEYGTEHASWFEEARPFMEEITDQLRPEVAAILRAIF